MSRKPRIFPGASNGRVRNIAIQLLNQGRGAPGELQEAFALAMGQLSPDEWPAHATAHPMTPEERDSVLAALRLWQWQAGAPVGIVEIATNGGEHDGLDDSEIDALCERLNV